MPMRHWLLAVLVLVALFAGADQMQIANYGTARDTKAYPRYVDARPYRSTDTHCGLRFKVDPANPEKRPTDWLSLEHAYPADWMADVFGCANRTECRRHTDATTKERFNRAEADLHNLLPAVSG